MDATAFDAAGGLSGRRADHRLLFLWEFLKHPEEVASLTPSSRFVERRIVELADIESARTIVELGTGTGGTTRAILTAMQPHARLLAIDVNRRFCDLLERIGDARLVVHNGSAHELRSTLVRHEFHEPDAVISGIPFSTLDRHLAARIVATIWAVLAPGGRFVAYQFRDRVDRLSRSLFGRPQVELALHNVPPLHVYRWRKRDDLPSVLGACSRRAA